MDYEIFEQNALIRLIESLESISAKDESEQNGFSYYSVSKEYRKIACLRLLSKANKKEFASSLAKSAQAWIYFMGLIKQGRNFEDEFNCGIRYISLFDALSCGIIKYAVAIAKSYPNKHTSDYEYEDDFLFYQFISQLTLLSQDEKHKDLKEILARWKEVLQGDPCCFYNICEALQHNDKDAFSNALIEIIQERNEKFENWKISPSYIEEVVASSQHIYVNGLALLRLAELLNIDISEEFESLPNISRVPIDYVLIPDGAWRNPS